MKINKHLKYVDFSYDESDKTFTITEEDGNRVILSKVYSFAFMRFVIRMAQRNWLRTKKVIESEPEINGALVADLQESIVFEEYEELESVEQRFH
tara:strand:+ start:336 stop:620 length:285 start_codon:yes stop_codon:yes gene_type:complete